jgi:hypothetical protein
LSDNIPDEERLKAIKTASAERGYYNGRLFLPSPLQRIGCQSVPLKQ